MTIRFATCADISGILRLLYQVGDVHHQIRPDIFRAGALKYDEAALLPLLSDPSRPIFIADVDGQVAGYCFCVHKVIEDSALSVGRQELYIDDLCVDENCRGQHIGRAIYNEILRYAKMRGCYNVTLNVWSCNEGAMRFYEKMGLKPLKVGM